MRVTSVELVSQASGSRSNRSNYHASDMKKNFLNNYEVLRANHIDHVTSALAVPPLTADKADNLSNMVFSGDALETHRSY